MKVGVYTLTRDRLEYTKRAFGLLAEKAGHPYTHLIFDNGSQDGTAQWLLHNQDSETILSDTNVGISAASNTCMKRLTDLGCDLIIKFDNDCEIVSDNIVGQFVEIFEDIRNQPLGPSYMLSPRVEKIVNQPHRARYLQLGGRRIGVTGIVGGLFQVMLSQVARVYRYPEKLPAAWGQDDAVCEWFHARGGITGYVEGLVVEHMDGTDAQAVKYPDYFKRKWKEEKHEASG